MGNRILIKDDILAGIISILMIVSIYTMGGILTSSINIGEIKYSQSSLPPIGDAPSFNGSTLYVGGSGPGNYSSIQAAIDNATNGDIIYVYSGVYQENIQVNKSLYLKGENKNTTIIDGRYIGNTVTILVDPVYISNFTITNGSYYGILLDNSRWSVISNSIIHNNSDSGIYARSSFYCEIKNNLISNNDYGIYLNINSRNFTIQDNNITLNNLRGIFLFTTYNTTIEDNDITNNEDGIGIFSSWNNSISYNQILNNCDYGIRIKNSTSNLIKSNTIVYREYGIYIFDKSNYNIIIGNTIKPDFYHNPIAIDDSVWTESNTPVLINILKNDYDPDGLIDSSTVIINTPPHHGTAVVESNGSITYTPTSGFNGNDTFIYRVRDNDNLLSNLANVNIYVRQSNASLEEVDQQQTIYSYDLQIYDIKKGAQIFYANSTILTKIDVYLRRQGIPPNDMTLEVREKNVSGRTIASTNIPPHQVHSVYSWITFDFPDVSVEKDTSYAIVLYTSGGDKSNCYIWGYGDDLYPKGSLWFSKGEWIQMKNNDGCFKTYRSVGIPAVTANDTYQTNEETTIIVKTPGVLGNDIDPDNGPNPIIAILENSVTNGSLTFYSNGSFRYTPKIDFIGIDSFTYKVYDGLTYSNITTVTINVTNNTGQTIRIENTLYRSTYNQIYHNNLYRGYKIDQVYDDCTNIWDNGYPSGGNYWSDYNEYSEGAYDNDNDSIIDTPYEIEGKNNKDNYPLLSAWATSPPTANFTWSPLHPDTLDIVKFIDLSTDSGNGSIVNWTWDFGDGNISYDQNPTHQYNTPGRYTVFLKVADDDGEIDTISKQINVSAIPPVAKFIYNPELPDTSDVIQFTDLSSDPDGYIVSWYWDFGDGNTSYLRNATHSYADNGTYNVTLTVTDDDNVSNTTYKWINVSNTPPIAVDDIVTINEDTSIWIHVLDNDYDTDGTLDPSSVTIISNPTHGTTNVNTTTGEILYTPDANYHGNDSFIYQVVDDDLDRDTATVNITITSVNDPPIANNDSYTTNENTLLAINATEGVLSNDTDIEGDNLTAVIIVNPTNGSVTLNENGSFTYTPNLNFHGVDTFIYQAYDGVDYSNNATVFITVIGTNDKPIANDDTYTTNEDTTLNIPTPGILSNDNDPDNNPSPLTAVLVNDVSHGTLNLNSDGSFTYTPNSNYNGIDTFTYQAYDGQDYSNIATVNITINPVNDPPVAENDTYSIIEDTILIVDAPGVLENDSDVDGDPLTALHVDGPYHGSLTFNSNGSFTYTPNPDFYGEDYFTYRDYDGIDYSNEANVTIIVVAANEIPIANDDTYTTNEDTTLNIPTPGILSNDNDPDNNPSPLTAVLVNDVSHGTLNLNSNGSFTYTPNSNYNGIDTFTYQAYDGQDYSNIATVNITINPVNDPPVANDNGYSLDEDTVLNVSEPGVLIDDTDADGDSITAVLVTNVSHGNLTLNSNGSFTYTPNPDFYGEDTFIYKAYDGIDYSNNATVHLYVLAVNDLPVANNDSYQTGDNITLYVPAPGVLGNDSDIDNSTLSAVLIHNVTHGNLILYDNGSFIYTPDNSFIGNDSFTYQAYDGMNYSNIATVNITVIDVNDIPIANNDSYTTNEDTTLNIPAPGVLNNDIDYDNGPNPLTAILVSNVAHGTLTLNSDGSFTYTPDPNYNGYDSFTYQAYDGMNYSNIATVNITIFSINDIPTANNDSYTMNEDSTLNVIAPGVLSNDNDPDGPSPLTTILISDVNHGYLTFYTNGSFSYTPFSNYNGYDSFTYQAYDGQDYSNIATVNITINAVNDPPVANDDYYTTYENSAGISIAVPGVLNNDSDVDGDPLTAYLVENVSHGTLVFHSDGSFNYTPNPDFYGLDLFRYNVSDGTDYSNIATVLINVMSTNIPPTGVNDSYTTNEDTTLNIPAPGVLNNDNDPDGPNPITAILIDNVSHGELIFYSNGSFIYTPEPDYFGYDWFSYQAFDGLDTSNLTFVNITIIDINDPPTARDDVASTSMDTSIWIHVLDNDYDTDGTLDPSSVIIVNGPTHGSTNINTTTGEIRYTPNSGWSGIDYFNYTVNDDDGATSNIASVTIYVTSTEQLDQYQESYTSDIQIYSFRWGGQSFKPSLDRITRIELYLSKTGNPPSHLNVEIRSNSISGPIITSTSISASSIGYSHSWISIDIPDVSVTPGDQYFIVIHTLNGDNYNCYKWGYRNSDVYPDGSLWFSSTGGGTWSSYPYDACFRTYGSSTPNIPPVANDDSVSTLEDTSIWIHVLDNDYDTDGTLDPSSVTVTSNPTHGTTNVNTTTGEILYTPDANYHGSDSFIYQVSDDRGGSDTATVSITIVDVNDPPVANDDSASTVIDTSIWIHVLDNDYDTDGTLDPSSVTVTSNPAHGTTNVNTTTGEILYTPNSGYVGSDSFIYRVSDDDGASDTATVSITISSGGTEQLDQHQETYNNGLYIYGTRWGAQSFIPTVNILTRVELYLGKAGSISTNLVVEIRSGNIQGPTITSASISASSIGYSYSWISIDIPDVSVTPGSQYFIVIRTTGGSGTDYYKWGFASSDLYPDGDLWFSSDRGQHWSEYFTYDTCFRTYGLP